MSDPKENPRQQPHAPRDEEEYERVDFDRKKELPDPDHTDPSTLPDPVESANTPVSEKGFNSEHDIGTRHAEPTDVTDTTNDGYTDSRYIDVGGGD